jgi:hypothetical protein
MAGHCAREPEDGQEPAVFLTTAIVPALPHSTHILDIIRGDRLFLLKVIAAGKLAPSRGKHAPCPP